MQAETDIEYGERRTRQISRGIKTVAPLMCISAIGSFLTFCFTDASFANELGESRQTYEASNAGDVTRILVAVAKASDIDIAVPAHLDCTDDGTDYKMTGEELKALIEQLDEKHITINVTPDAASEQHDD